MKAVIVETEGKKVLFESDSSVVIPPSMAPVPVVELDIRPGESAVGVADDLRLKFKEIQDVIVECAKAIHRVVEEVPTPDEVGVEFGVSLGGEVGIPFVTKGTANANMKISIKWKPKAEKES